MCGDAVVVAEHVYKIAHVCIFIQPHAHVHMQSHIHHTYPHPKTTQAGGVNPHSTLQTPTADLWTPPSSFTPTNHPEGIALGQVTGVALGVNSTMWVLHRGSRAWETNSFDPITNRIVYDSYIQQPTVLLLDQDTGRVLRAMGTDLLSMPHMITLGRDGALWVTDVGRHQVIKMDPHTGNVLMTIGTEGEPGNGPLHLCKPTHVQLDSDGNVYVSDGYCNARVAVFDASGKHVKDLMVEGKQGGLVVPHSMVLDGCGGVLLVANREGKEVRARGGMWVVAHETPCMIHVHMWMCTYSVLLYVAYDHPYLVEHHSHVARSICAFSSYSYSYHHNNFTTHTMQSQLVGFALATGSPSVHISTEQYGYPYAVTAGPYGTTLVLVWDRNINNSTVLVLDTGTVMP